MKMSDLITARILQLLNDSGTNVAEIQRNELASVIGCVPSQINYVLSSRFTPEHGYIIESRRGGGGYIRITRVSLDRASALMHIVNSIGEEIDASAARIIIDNSAQAGLISGGAVTLMRAAISTGVMRELPPNMKDRVRAALMKQMLMTQI